MKHPHAKAGPQQDMLDFLRDPSSYPGCPATVTVIETHFAWVFLPGQFAYKLKKPSCHASMDYRSLPRRRWGCREELRLNRRLAPRVYVDVVPVSRQRDGTLRLGRGGTVVDWLVRMRRLPADRFLDLAIRVGGVSDADMALLSRQLTGFFRAARKWPMTRAAYVGRLRARIAKNGRDLRAQDLGLRRRRVDEVIRLQRDVLRRAASLLAARGPHLVEGHGDLRPEHVCVADEPCVIDCLEFNADLRRLDPAEEIAFLALECARLGSPALGEGFIQRYQAFGQDPVPDVVWHFYQSQCAATRAVIAAWHVRDPACRNRRHWIAKAHSYLADALRHARAALAVLPPLTSRVARASGAARGRAVGPRSAAARPARTGARPVA